MEREKGSILSFVDLEIGFISNGNKKILTSPLNSSASAGELIAILGHNGVGKSTLLRTISGLQIPINGSVYVKGKNLNEYERIEVSKNIGYISTEIIKVGNMTVYDLVALGRFPHTNWMGKICNNDHEIITDSIEKVGMMDLSDKYITELSDGERQRAMIARVLAQDTGLLVMDEPTAFLDIRNKFEIVHLMHTLTRERGKTVIFSTHDLQTAINEADKIWLVLENRIIEGAPEDLILNGSFNLLFSDSRLKFDDTEGTFVRNKDHRKAIFLEGEGLSRLWTERALNRIGYYMSESITDQKIKILYKDNTIIWKLSINDNVQDFFSVYELIKYIENTCK
jgi:iron complex transport system ATP-binding protein